MAEHGGGGALREILAVFGFEVDDHGLKEGENKLKEFGEKIEHTVGKLKQLALGIAEAFAVEKLFEFAENSTHAISEMEHAADALGISIDKVQEYKFAAKSLGFELEDVTQILRRMQVAQGRAENGSKETAKAFARVGLSVRDLKGKQADELFDRVTEGLEKVTDPGQRAAIVMQLMGRNAGRLATLLKEGKIGLDELKEAFKGLGKYSEDTIEKSKKFEKAQARLSQANVGLKDSILGQLYPVLTKVSDWLTKGVKWLADTTKGTQIWKVVLGEAAVVAGVFAASLALANLPLLAMVGVFLALALIVEDVIGLFQGRGSLIGKQIDKIFGQGASLAFVKEAKEIWKSLSEYIGTAVDKIIAFNEWRKHIADKEVGIFKSAVSFIKPGTFEAPKVDSDFSVTGGGNFGEGMGVILNGDVNYTINAAAGQDENKIGEAHVHHFRKMLNSEKRAAVNTAQRARTGS